MEEEHAVVQGLPADQYTVLLSQQRVCISDNSHWSATNTHALWYACCVVTCKLCNSA